MARRYHYTTTLSWGGDEPTAELEVECTYEVAWGTPEVGRGYLADPRDYDPGSSTDVECIQIVSVDGKPWPVDLSYGFQTVAQDAEMLIEKLEDHEGAMIEAALQENENRSDDYADYHRRQRGEQW